MKVAMVMQMSPESATADVMTQAFPDLSARWDLEVWCPSEASYRSCPVPVRPYAAADDEVLKALAAFDLVVYVLEDSPLLSRILPLARRLPGLAVLHDASLTNLVRHTAVERDELDLLVPRVEVDFGSEKSETLDEVAVEGSLGAVVHSRWHAARVDGLTLGEVTVAPLPVPFNRLGFDEKSGTAYAAALLEAGERALATKPLAHLSADLGARLRRLDLHQEPAVVNAVADLAFDLFDLA
jgi:hypothetical protein